jgi:hypothetical protein
LVPERDFSLISSDCERLPEGRAAEVGGGLEDLDVLDGSVRITTVSRTASVISLLLEFLDAETLAGCWACFGGGGGGWRLDEEVTLT